MLRGGGRPALCSSSAGRPVRIMEEQCCIASNSFHQETKKRYFIPHIFLIMQADLLEFLKSSIVAQETALVRRSRRDT